MDEPDLTTCGSCGGALEEGQIALARKLSARTVWCRNCQNSDDHREVPVDPETGRPMVAVLANQDGQIVDVGDGQGYGLLLIPHGLSSVGQIYVSEVESIQDVPRALMTLMLTQPQWDFVQVYRRLDIPRALSEWQSAGGNHGS